MEVKRKEYGDSILQLRSLNIHHDIRPLVYLRQNDSNTADVWSKAPHINHKIVCSWSHIVVHESTLHSVRKWKCVMCFHFAISYRQTWNIKHHHMLHQTAIVKASFCLVCDGKSPLGSSTLKYRAWRSPIVATSTKMPTLTLVVNNASIVNAACSVTVNFKFSTSLAM